MSGKGLIYGFVFDGKGGGDRIRLEDVQKWKPEHGILWLHFDYSNKQTQEWILKESGLGDLAAEALLTEETRPRTFIIGDAALIDFTWKMSVSEYHLNY